MLRAAYFDVYLPNRGGDLVNASDADIEKMRKAVQTFFKAAGVNENGGLKREDWVEANQVDRYKLLETF